MNYFIWKHSRLALIQFVILVIALGCTKNSPPPSGSTTITVSGADQAAEPGKAYEQDLVFEVRDSNGVALPNVRILVETLSEPAKSSHLPGFEVMTTDSTGKSTAKAVAGNLGGYKSDFRASLARDPSTNIAFSLMTAGAAGGGGDQNGDVSGEDDQAKGGGGSTSGEEKGDDKGNEQGGGVNNSGNQGANKPNPSNETPSDPNVARYLVTTTNGGAETAGQAFGLKVVAINKDGKTVVSHSGLKELRFFIQRKVTAPGQAPTYSDIPAADFGAFTPTYPTQDKFQFVKGELSLPNSVTIKKFFPNIIIKAVDKNSLSGEAILDMKVGPLHDVQIAAEEEVPGLLAPGEELKGQNYQLESNLPILVPTTPATLAEYPPLFISTGTSLTLSVNGYDAYTNLYQEPILCKWSAEDVGNSVAEYPTSPVFTKYLALKANRVAVNLFVPNEAGLGMLKVDECQTLANGTNGMKSDRTGVFNAVADKPTVLYVDFYEANGPTPPDTTVVQPLEKVTAGKPVFMRLSAGDTFGTIDDNWVGEKEITLTINSTSENPGWPLPVDAAVSGEQTQNIKVPVFMGLPLRISDGGAGTAPFTYTFKVKFVEGRAWVRDNTGANQTLPVDDREMAELYLYNSNDRPRIQTADLINNLAGTHTIANFVPNDLKHMKIAFSDAYAVPAGYETQYPDEIKPGTKFRTFRMQVGDGRGLNSTGFDEFGNEIGLVSSNWEGVGLPNHFLAVAFNTKINFLSPKDVLPAGGTIKATSVADPAVSVETGTIIVDPGIPAAFVITPLNNAVPLAGTKFGIEIKAVDSSGATAVQYDTSAPDALNNDVKVAVKIRLTGATLAPQVSWFSSGAQHTTYQALMDEYRNGKDFELEFENGVAKIEATDAEAFKFFFSSETPFINVTTLDQKISGNSDPLTIRPEALVNIRAKLLKEIVHPDATYAQGSFLNDLKLTAGITLRLETVGFDRYGNSLGPVEVDWNNADDNNPLAPPPAIAVNAYNGDIDNFLLTDASTSTIYAPRKSGKAYIRMTTSAGVCNASFPCETPAGAPAMSVTSFSGIVDAEIGKPISMRVVDANPATPARVANQVVAVSLQLLDINGELVTNFTGDVELTTIEIVSLPGQSMSVFGTENIVPAPQTVRFENGLYTLGGFQFFNIYDTPRVRVIAKDPTGTDPLLNAGDSAPFNILASTAHSIRIVNQPQVDGGTNRGMRHRPAIFDSMNNPLAVLTGSTLDLYAGRFDLYGNWVSDVNVRWDTPATCTGLNSSTYSNNLAGNLVPSGAGSNDNQSQIVPGSPIGKGCLQITNNEAAVTQNTAVLTDIVIDEGTPAKLKLVILDPAGRKAEQVFGSAPTIEPGFKLVAEEPIRMRLTVHDAGGSVSTSVNKPAQSYSIQFINAADSDPSQCTVTGANKQVRRKNLSDSVETVITNTTYTATFPTALGAVSENDLGHFFVPKAGTSFTIRVNATIDGFPMAAGEITNLKVSPNDLIMVNLRTQPNGAGLRLQGLEHTITADQPLMLYAAGYDKVCNFISDSPAVWTSTGDIDGRLVGDTAAGSYITVNPKTVGEGDIKAVVTSLADIVPCQKCGKAKIKISHGEAASIVASTQHTNGGVSRERAGVPFKFSAKIIDQHGNKVTAFTGSKALTLSWNATSSPGGYQPLLASAPTYNFIAGELDQASFPALTFPAAFTAAPTKHLRVANPGEIVALTIRHTDSGKTIEGVTNFTVERGPIRRLTMYDVSTAVPAATPVPPLKLTKGVDTLPMFLVNGFDPADNVYSNLVVGWETSTNPSDAFFPSSSHLDRTTGSFVTVRPSVIGNGTVRAEYMSNDTEVGNVTLAVTTEINVTPGVPVSFDIVAPATVNANELFGVKIIAKDVKGNIVDFFPNGENFNFSFANAHNSPSSASFAGNVAPIPAADGSPLTVNINTFNAPDNGQAVIVPTFKLTNAKDVAFLKVSWAGFGGVTRTGQSDLIRVNVGPASFYRITKEQSGSLDLIATDTVVAGNPFAYYANSFDAVGNFIGNINAIWKGTDVLEPIIKDGVGDLIATSILKTTNKVKKDLTGQINDPIEGQSVISIHDPLAPAVPLASVDITVRPNGPSKLIAYLTDSSGAVPVASGAYIMGQTAVAGEDYFYRLEVQDIYGNRADFDGVINASITMPTGAAAMSQLGLLPTIDQPGSVNFVDGLWSSSVSNKKAVFTKYGMSPFIVSDLSASPLGGISHSIQVQKGSEPASIRISRGALEADPVVHPANINEVLVAGVSRTYFAAQFDAGGNWIGAAPVLWTGTNVLADPIVTAGHTGTSINITPAVVGDNNQLQISWDHDNDGGTPTLQYALTNISVNSSADVKDILVSAPSTITADSCFYADLTVRDPFDNPISDYTGLKNLVFSYDSNIFIANYVGHTTPSEYPVNNAGYQFSQGQSLANAVRFCLRDANVDTLAPALTFKPTTITITAPGTIATDGNPVKGSFTITVTPGAPSQVQFAQAQRNGLNQPEAAPVCDISLTADDTSSPIFATVHDQHGNIIPDYFSTHNTTNWRWLKEGVLNGKGTTVSASELRLTPNLASMKTATSEVDVGMVRIRNVDTSPIGLSMCGGNPGNLLVHVFPGAPHHYEVIVDGDNVVRATDNFAVQVKARDQHENIAFGIDASAVPLTFSYENAVALPSPTLPIQTPPSVVSASVVGTVSAVFADGVYTSAVSNRLPNSKQTGIKVRAQSAGMAASDSPVITVQPGPAANIYLVKDPVTGQPAPNLDEISYTQTYRLYPGVFDTLGNYISGPTPVSAWVIAGFSIVDESPSASLVQFDAPVSPAPTSVGVMTQTVSGNRVSGAFADVTVHHTGFGGPALSHKVRLKFMPEAADKLVATKILDNTSALITDLTSSPIPELKAGQEFYVVVEARDSNNNVEVTFPENFGLTKSAVAPVQIDYTTGGNPSHSPTVPASGSVTFNHTGRGIAKIGPFIFYKAGGSHSITISDNDAARDLTPANIADIKIVPAATIDHLRFFQGADLPPAPGQLLMDPATLSAVQTTYSFSVGGFDAYGNYSALIKSNYTWAWDPACPGCNIGLSGSGSNIAILSPINAGSGRVTALADDPKATGKSVTSPLLTVEAGQGAKMVVEVLYNDQNSVTPGEQKISIADLPNAAAWKVFDGSSPANEYHRAGIPFSLRIKAVDQSNNLAPSFCDGNLDPVNTPRVCDMKVTYAIIPSPGPDLSGYLPTGSTIVKVRWNNGYGTIVSNANTSVDSRPFVMAKAGEVIRITLSDANDAAIIGTTDNIQIKQGPLADIKFRALMNDSAGVSTVYETKVEPFEETRMLTFNAAGYDGRGNYIADMAGDWTVTNLTGDATLNPATGSVSKVDVTAVAQGASTVKVDIAATDDHPLVTESINLVITAAPAKSFKMTLVANDCDLINPANLITPVEVLAGNKFKICIEAKTEINGGGSTATSYTGNRPLVFTAANSIPSTLNFSWQAPVQDSGANLYSFTNGRAVLSDIIFTGIPADNDGAIDFIANDTANNVSGSLVIKNRINTAGYVRMRMGASANTDALIDFTVTPAGQRTALYGHLYDKGGNYLRLVNAGDQPVWSYQSETAAVPLGPKNGVENPSDLGVVVPSLSNINPINFVPQDATISQGAELGLNVVVNGTSISTSATNMTITGSTASSLTIIPENNIYTWAATDCFRLTVVARDAQSNLSSLYLGSKSLVWEMTVASTGDPYPTLIGGDSSNELPTKSIVKLADGNYTFGAGTYQAPFASFCLRDATNIPGGAVRIRVTDTGANITGYADITVTPGPAARYGIAESTLESKIVCDTQTFVAGTAKNYYLHELDNVGNYLRPIPISANKWTPIGVLLEPGVTSGTGDGHFGVHLDLTKVGVGTVKYNFDGPDPAPLGTAGVLHCSPLFNVINSNPNSLLITNENGINGEYAAQDFWTEIRVLDQHGNVHIEYNQTTDILFEARRKGDTNEFAMASPYNIQPKVAGQDNATSHTLPVTFTNGVWKQTGTKFRLPRANDEIRLFAKAPLTTLQEGYIDIPVKAGPNAWGIQIRDQADATGRLVNDNWTADPTNEIYTIGYKMFFAVLNDQYGNFMSKTTQATWSLPPSGVNTPAEPLPPALVPEPLDHGIAKYDPDALGDGRIRVAYTGPLTLVQSSYETGVIDIKQAPITKWRVTGWSPSPADAALPLNMSGVPYTVAGAAMRLKIEALDAENTVDATFTEDDVEINVAFLGATPAPQPFSATKIPTLAGTPITDELPHTIQVDFVDGVAYVEIQLFNKDDRARFTVSGRSWTPATTPEIAVVPDTMAALQVRYPQGFGDAEKTIKADQTLPIEVVGIDSHGNNFGPVKANLSFSFAGIADYDGYPGVDSYDQFIGILEPAALDPAAVPPVTVSTFIPERIGRGMIAIDCQDARCTTHSISNITTAQITVDPGKVRRFVVEVEGQNEKFRHEDGATSYVPAWYEPNYIVTAGEMFGIRVTAVDVFGNTVRSYAGGTPLTFNYDTDGSLATNNDAVITSPIGTAPTIPGAGSDWTFQNGVWRSALKAEGGTGFVIGRANLTAVQKPNIVVRDLDPAKNYEGKTGERIDVLPSELASLRFASEASNAGSAHAGQEICPAGVCPNSAVRKTMQTGDVVRLYMAGFDSQGNYIEDKNVNWQITSTATPPVGEAIGQALSACDSLVDPGTGITCNLAGTKYFATTFYSSFTPKSVGDWNIVAISADDPTIKSQLRVEIESSSATKFRAFVVYDNDDDGIPDAPGPSGSGPYRVDAGRCFSIEIHALDGNNNPTNFSGLVDMDFFSDVPMGNNGFQPIPYGGPVYQSVNFVNGKAITSRSTVPGHICSQNGTSGTFVFMKNSQPSNQTWFIRVSDGAEIGLQDAEVQVSVDKGSVDFVALMAGNPAPGSEHLGRRIGASRTFSPAPDGVDITNPANWTDPLPCGSEGELAGLCGHPDLGLTGHNFRNYYTHLTYDILFHRFYLVAFDKGGNFLQVVNGDWTPSKTTAGEVAEGSSQWTTPKTAVHSFRPQYVRADGAFNTFADRNDDAAAPFKDVTNTSAIFFYPAKSKSGNRITVKNIEVDGKYFYINSSGDFTVYAGPTANVHVETQADRRTFIAAESIDLKLYRLDGYNNPAYTGSNAANVSLSLCRGSDATCATNIAHIAGRVAKPNDGIYAVTDLGGGHNGISFHSNQVLSTNAGEYRFKATVDNITDLPPWTFKVFPAQPLSFAITYSHMDPFYGQTDPCYTIGKVDVEKNYRAVVVDRYGNAQPVSIGWQRATDSGTTCNNTGSVGVFATGFQGQAESIYYKDTNGNVISPTISGGWCYSPRAAIKPRRSKWQTAFNTAEEYGGKFPTTFTVTDTESPLYNQTFNMTSGGYPLFDIPLNASNSTCYHSSRVIAGTPVKFTMEFLGEIRRAGEPFDLVIKPRDKFDNDSTDIIGTTASFDITWNPATTLNAPDLCTVRGQTAGCPEGTQIVNGQQRQWGAAHSLTSGAQAITFYGEPGSYILARGDTGDIFTLTNSTANPQFQICYQNGSGPAVWDSLNNFCMNGTVKSGAAPELEIFASLGSSAGGRHLDTLPTLNSGNTSEDKTFLLNETATFFVGRYDRFGNFTGAAPTVQWSLVDNGTSQFVWDANDNLLTGAGYITEFTSQFTNWDSGNPLAIGTNNRLPRGAKLMVTAPGLPTLDLGAKFRHVDAPPGPSIIRLYSADDPGTQYMTTPTINVGQTIYFSLEVRDVQGNRMTSFTGDKNMNISPTGVISTRDNRTGTFPASGTFRFCNGLLVPAAYDLSAPSCPADGTAPAAVNLARYPITFESSYISNPAIAFTVDVNGQSSIGQLPAINVVPGVATYYSLNPGTTTRTLSSAMAFNEGPVTVQVRAFDQYGNFTTNVPGSENAVTINIYNPSAGTEANLCTEVTLGSCASDKKIFKCGNPVGNCLHKTIDMTSGTANLQNVEFDSPGIYYVAVTGSAVKTFNPGNTSQLNNRGAQLFISCGMDCIDHFDLVYTTPQTVGVSFNLGIRMVDGKGRLIGDAGLNSLMSSKTLIWDNALLSRINGGAPDNRAAVGFGSGDGRITLNFAGGQASIGNMVINQVNDVSHNGALATNVFKFVIEDTPTKVSVAPSPFTIEATPAHEYRISVTGNPATLHASPSGTFDTTIQSVDRGGNYVNNPPTLTLIPVKQSGPAANSGAFEGGTNTCTLVNGQCTLSGLYYRVPNTVRLNIQGNGSAVGTYPQIAFSMQPGTIASYEMTMASTVWAYDSTMGAPGGTNSTTATIKAKDGANNEISSYTGGFADDLDTTLAGYAVVSTNNQPTWPNTKFCSALSAWSNATATCTLEMQKSGNVAAANLSMTINGVAASKNFASTVTVSPNILNSIRICGTSGGCVSSLATGTDEADDNAVEYYINGYDFFGNHRGVETTGTSWTVANTVPGGLTDPTDYSMISTAGANGKVSFRGFSVPASPTKVTLRASAPVPATDRDIEVTVTAPTGITELRLVTHTPDPHNAMIAGETLSVTRIEAYYTANGQQRLQTSLSGSRAIAVAYNGTTAPGYDLPATVNCTFSAGVCTTPLNFQLTRAELNRTLTLSYGGQSATITGINVAPKAPKRLAITTGSTTVTAGTGFGATVTAYDEFNNQASNYNTSLNLTFAWENTTNTNSANGTYHNAPAEVAATGSYAFTNGVLNIAGSPFVLKKKTDTAANPMLTISSEDSPSVDTITKAGPFTINAEATVNYVKILGVSTNDTAWTSEINTHTMTTDIADVKALYAHGYDRFGNWVSRPSVTWTGAGILTGKADGTGDSINVTPDAPGTGTVTANHAASSSSDVTGTFTVNPGVLADFLVSAPGSATAGQNIPVTITARDAKGNTVTGFTGSQAVAVTYNGAATASPAPSSTAPVRPTGNITFASGVYTSNNGDFRLYNAGNTNVTITAAYSGKTGTSGNIATVAAGPLYSIKATAAGGTTVTAGADIPITLRAYDQWDNFLSGEASSRQYTFAWSANTAVSAPNANNGQTHDKPAAATSYTFASGQYIISNAFKLKNKADSGLSLSFTTSPAATSYVGLTFTINSSSVDFIKVHDVNTANRAWALEFTTDTMAATATKTFYSHGYDLYGNWTGLVTSDWTGTAGLAGEVTGTGTTSGVLNPVGVDSGTVVATSGGLSDATGLITVVPGALDSFTVTAPATVTAGSDFTVTATAKDAEGNTITSFPNSAVVFTFNNASNSPAPSSTAPTLPSGTLTFTNGVYTSSAGHFKLYNASNNNVTVTATHSGKTGTSTAITTVNAAAPASLNASGVTATVTAGSAITGTLLLRDTYSNLTSGGTPCSVAASGWGSSPGHGPASAKAPDYPGAINPASAGTFNIPGASLMLYNVGTGNLTFTASGGSCGGGIATNVSVTVNPAAVNHIWLNTTNTEPGSHSTSHTCPEGTTITCSLYSWAWDSYGNKIGGDTWQCPQWNYSSSSGHTQDPADNTHTGSIASSNLHIDGSMSCVAGAVSASTTVTGRIHKQVGWSCGVWSCNGTTPQRSCTVNNATGYPIDSIGYTFTGTGSASGCTGALASGTCNVTVSGTSGQALGTFGPTSLNWPDTSRITMTGQTVVDNSAAPNCSTTLTTAAISGGDGWQCHSTEKTARYGIRLTNSNALNAATFAASTFDGSPNNMTIIATTCNGGAAANGGTCDITVEHPGTSQDTAAVQFNETSGFFNDPIHSIATPSPICKAQMTLISGTEGANNCGGANTEKTVIYTLKNENTKQTARVAGITDNSGIGSVQNNNCTGATLAPLDTCTFEVFYTDALGLPAVDGTNISVNMDGSHPYFTGMTITGGTAGNHCEP